LENKEYENGSCKVHVPFNQGWFDELMKWKKFDLVSLLQKILKSREDRKVSAVKMGIVVNWYLEKYGQTAQVLTAMEEMGELIAALNQYFFRDKISADSLSKEIADVEIMMQSLRVIIGNDLVDCRKEEQIEKMLKFKEESEKKAK